MISTARSRLALALGGAAVGVLVFAATLLTQVDSRKALEAPMLWTALIAQVAVVLAWVIWSSAPRRILIAVAFVELALGVVWYIAAPNSSGPPPASGVMLSSGIFAFSAVAISALLLAGAAVVHPGRAKSPQPTPSAPPPVAIEPSPAADDAIPG